jgi:hypothetical protein
MLLRLQQTVGNAALLRQPQPASATDKGPLSGFESFVDSVRRFFEEAAVRNEVEQDWVRREELRKRHEQRVAEAREHAQPHAFKGAGVKTTTLVDDRTAALLQGALAESLVLRPYIKDKFPAAKITEGFKIHDSDAEFEHSFAKLHNIRDSPSAVHAQVEGIRGFFHSPTRTIHLKPRANLGEALHEAIHKLASPAFIKFFGSFWEEGVAQYFANSVLAEQGLAQLRTPLYEPNLRCAKRLVKFTSRDLVAQAYFVNHGPLMNTLTTKLGVDHNGLKELINNDTLCERLPK